MSLDFGAYYREFAPLDTLLADDRVSEIMVNGYDQVYVEIAGKLYESKTKFTSNVELVKLIQAIGAKVGRKIDTAMPMLDARLMDGSRVNAVLEPVAVGGPSLTIRKFSRQPLTAEDLIKNKACTPAGMGFMQAAVQSKLNILVIGGTSTGKTTLLNVLSSFIGDEERIVTIEDTAELQLRQRHVVKLEARKMPEPLESKIEIRDLVINALRMRPDRIVVGECRGGEAMDMLQSMNTGHDGGMTTLHANSPRDALARLETMAMMSDIEMPLLSIRRQIASALDLVVQMIKVDGQRKVGKIEEIIGMEGDIVSTQAVFEYMPTGVDNAGLTTGELQPKALRPHLMQQMDEAGVECPPAVRAIWPARPKSSRR
jgi:pilus assembly protein CpaF